MSSAEDLKRQLEAAYAAIRELDDDLAAGRLGPSDHAELKRRSERRAAGLLTRLRQFEQEGRRGRSEAAPPPVRPRLWSPLALTLGAVALLVDLGRPDRFIRAGSQVARSWISRGAIFTSIFLLFGVLRIAAQVAPGLPWAPGGGLGQAVGLLATLGALGVMLYTGFLLSQSPSIPFWNTTMLPLLFASFAFTCGVGVVLVMLPILGEKAIDLMMAAIKKDIDKFEAEAGR